jgi:hypothetical protein
MLSHSHTHVKGGIEAQAFSTIQQRSNDGQLLASVRHSQAKPIDTERFPAGRLPPEPAGRWRSRFVGRLTMTCSF